MQIRKANTYFLFFILSLTPFSSFPQKKIVKNGSFYCSWGYNTEWYTKSNININQPSLGNNYTFTNIQAHDHKGWDDRLLRKPLTVPQYNYRIGYYFNEKQDKGFEINFDHTKYVVTIGQADELKGTLHGRAIDSTIITGDSVLLWQLNNGANFLQFNYVKKYNLLDCYNSKFVFDCMLKAGAGPVIPHVQNTIFGHENIPHFQFGGWNVDADISFRATFFKHVFLEYANKVVYARYFHLKIYEGLAKQSFGCYQMFLVLGGTFKL